ncbi:hypothetical protein [Leisingera sp. F5]|uniref:hypothetical protein n=1 Tax=Leisingera sp. F5 TaxID=1813816 RepID=UPI0025BFFD6A|nr:hypothetical protein [Leisingera sp. F5]
MTSTDARGNLYRLALYRKFEKLYSLVRRRFCDAGIKPPSKCGPYIFRHACAAEMLCRSVPQKVIGDLSRHCSTASTAPYPKLATEYLRAIALDVRDAKVLV